MLELIVEIAGFLGAAAFIGVFLGYLVWGWGQRERIETARADGAARARTSVHGDAALEEKVETLTAERDKLKKSLASLKEGMAAQKVVPSAVDAPVSAEPAQSHLPAPETTDEHASSRPGRRIRLGAPMGRADTPAEPEGATPPAESPEEMPQDVPAQGSGPKFGKPDSGGTGDMADQPDPVASDHEDHAIPAFFGDRPGRRSSQLPSNDADALDPNDIEDGEFMDADIELVDEREHPITKPDAADNDDIDAAISGILEAVRGDETETPSGGSRLFARNERVDVEDATEVDATDAMTEPSQSGGADDSHATELPPAFFRVPPEEIDDLKLIRGVGIKMEALLNENGVYQYRQIAGFSEDDIEWLNTAIDSFPGRIRRDNWVGQAAALNREKYGQSDEQV